MRLLYLALVTCLLLSQQCCVVAGGKNRTRSDGRLVVPYLLCCIVLGNPADAQADRSVVLHDCQGIPIVLWCLRPRHVPAFGLIATFDPTTLFGLCCAGCVLTRHCASSVCFFHLVIECI